MSVPIYTTEALIASHGNAGFSHEIVHYTTVINIVGICSVISVFGVIGNIVNMIVLQRLGFQETVNITLFAIAFSDLVSVITILWMAICFNPLFYSADLPFLPLEIQLPTGSMSRVIAMNATSWLTAYVTFERCICITFPLKVKEIITPVRTKIVIVLIFIMVVALQIPTYLTAQMAWKFDNRKNQSLLGLVIKEEYAMLNAVAIYITNVMGPFLSFSFIGVCSVILVTKLYQKSKWRQHATNAIGKDEVLGKRDRKVMKMILTVAVIFMIGNIPAMLLFALSAQNTELTPAGSLANNFYVAMSFGLLFGAANASVNIFVYYNMSSKYKDTFRHIFCRRPVDSIKGT